MRYHSPKTDRRPGGVAVWLVLGMSIIIGMLALGLDGGRLHEERRRAQATADAAALAAAADLYENWWSHRGKDVPKTARAAALQAAAANGYANDGATSVVTVNIPPASGEFAGRTEYVEVIAEYRVAATFSKVFTRQDLPVRARAVAHGAPMRIGLHMLDPSAPSAFHNQALALAVLGNPIIVNSTDSQAFRHDSIGAIIAGRYDVSGDYVNSGGGLILGKMRTGVRPTADPLRKLAAPNPAAAPVRSANPLTINALLLPVVLQPGVYRGGIRIRGASIVLMAPGVYILEGGGFRVENLATVLGPGVVLYNTQGAFPDGPIAVSSLGKVVMTAPTAGTYQGISIFQDRALKQPITVSGAGTMLLTGTVYAKGADVSLASLLNLGIDTLGGAYICNTLRIAGVGSVNIDLGNNPPRVPDVTLVE
jgi:hypothetical protein